MEGAFVAASTGVLGVVVLTSVEIFNMFNDASGRTWMKGNVAEDGMCMGLWAGWVLPPTALVFYSVFRAAAVTEQANRVPALADVGYIRGVRSGVVYRRLACHKGPPPALGSLERSSGCGRSSLGVGLLC